MRSSLFFYPTDANGIKYGPILFSWLHVFLFGSVIGAYYKPLQRSIASSRHKALFDALAWIVLFLAIIAPPQLRRELGVPVLSNFLDPVTVGYPMLVLVCTIFLLGPFSVFKLGVLRWYGKISYSLYLLHLFVVYAVMEVVATGTLPAELGFPVVLALSTLLAAASFYWLERPSQRMLRVHFAGQRPQPKAAL